MVKSGGCSCANRIACLLFRDSSPLGQTTPLIRPCSFLHEDVQVGYAIAHKRARQPLEYRALPAHLPDLKGMFAKARAGRGVPREMHHPGAQLQLRLYSGELWGRRPPPQR